jgi:hypothetical protein
MLNKVLATLYAIGLIVSAPMLSVAKELCCLLTFRSKHRETATRDT